MAPQVTNGLYPGPDAIGRVDAPLFIDDSPNMSMMEIRAVISSATACGLMIIDYLQLDVVVAVVVPTGFHDLDLGSSGTDVP